MEYTHTFTTSPSDRNSVIEEPSSCHHSELVMTSKGWILVIVTTEQDEPRAYTLTAQPSKGTGGTCETFMHWCLAKIWMYHNLLPQDSSLEKTGPWCPSTLLIPINLQWLLQHSTLSPYLGTLSIPQSLQNCQEICNKHSPRPGVGRSVVASLCKYADFVMQKWKALPPAGEVCSWTSELAIDISFEDMLC